MYSFGFESSVFIQWDITQSIFLYAVNLNLYGIQLLHNIIYWMLMLCVFFSEMYLRVISVLIEQNILNSLKIVTRIFFSVQAQPRTGWIKHYVTLRMSASSYTWCKI